MLENLKKEMEKREIKNKDIAELLGIKSPAVSKRLYGSVKLHDDEKKKIANLLNIKDYEYLFKDTGYTPPKRENEETIFSKRFSELLERDKRTQKQIAEALGVNERTIIDWKHGKQTTNAEMLRKISVTLNASIAYLCGESDYYPSDVNYLDNSMNEYQKQKNNLASAVKNYLKYLGYDIKILDRIVLYDPLKHWNDHEFFNNFYKMHIEEYERIDKLERELRDYSINFYKKYGVNIDYKSDDEPTDEEKAISEKLSKDETYRNKVDQIEDLDDSLSQQYSKLWDKQHSHARRVEEFFFNLPDKISKLFYDELSDILEENKMFNYKYRNLHDGKIKLSVLKKRLFEYKTIKNDISKMNDFEFINYKNESGDLRHRFSSSLYEYKGSLSDKNSILDYLDAKIKETSNSIKQWKEYIEDLEKK